MKKIKWKKAKGGQAMEHILEGYVNGDFAFQIEGRLCVTDLREMKASKTWVPPKHYPIKDREDGKRIAHEILNEINLEEHEASWRKEEEKHQQTANTIREAQEFLDKLKANKL